MKRLGLFLLVIVAFFFAANCYAAMSTGYTDQVLLVDTNGDTKVSFDVSLLVTGSTGWLAGIWDDSGIGSFNEFTTDGSGQYITQTLDAGLTDFAISDGAGTVKKLSEGAYTVDFKQETPDGSGIYDQIIINWGLQDDLSYVFVVGNPVDVEGDGGFAMVPIPATALLFCGSILGIVGIRRKMVH